MGGEQHGTFQHRRFKSLEGKVFLLGAMMVLVIVTSSVSWFGYLRYECVGCLPSDFRRLKSSSHMSVSKVTAPFQMAKSSLSTSGCSIPRFRNDSRPVELDMFCHRPEPSEHSCRAAEEYFEGKEPEECGGQYEEICMIEFEDRRLSCHQESCPNGVFVLGTFAKDKGRFIWYPLPTAKRVAAKFNYNLKNRDPSVSLGLAFIQCRIKITFKALTKNARNQKKGILQGGEVRSQQLLVFPNLTGTIGVIGGTGAATNLSINIILIDSVSHSQFYRTLPLSVEKLREMDQDERSRLLVFNYDRMQSLRARTFESLQVLMTGLFSDIPSALPARPVLEAMKRGGYDILWYEDVCWHYQWGISRYFDFKKKRSSMDIRWKALRKVMSSYHIDNLGVSMVSCEIFRSNDVINPFHRKDICYNGRQHHWYILEYIKQVQSLYHRTGKPFFQFTELNVGHDEDGLRIKTLDTDLASYLEHLSTSDNTLTMLLADHGNTYTPYAMNEEEGRLEKYHPVFFLLAPRNIEDIVGRSGIEGLTVNQDRLISFLDVHLMMRHLIDDGSSRIPIDPRLSGYDHQARGLLDPVSSSRTCGSLPRFPGAECICRNSSGGFATTDDSRHLILADFGLGFLNNRIQSQVESGQAGEGTAAVVRSCQNLLGTSIDRVIETEGMRNGTEITMRIFVRPGKPFTDTDGFSVVFLVSRAESTVSVDWYERISVYGRYGACADQQVEEGLCICDVSKNNTPRKPLPIVPDDYPKIFNHTSKRKDVSECLSIMERRRETGTVLEGLNRCLNVIVEFEVNGATVNVASTSKLPARFTIRGNQSLFLVAFLAVGDREDWSISYNVSVISG